MAHPRIIARQEQEAVNRLGESRNRLQRVLGIPFEVTPLHYSVERDPQLKRIGELNQVADFLDAVADEMTARLSPQQKEGVVSTASPTPEDGQENRQETVPEVGNGQQEQEPPKDEGSATNFSGEKVADEQPLTGATDADAAGHADDAGQSEGNGQKDEDAGEVVSTPPPATPARRGRKPKGSK